jgi:Spy/CpxP family protein refolding chaperone
MGKFGSGPRLWQSFKGLGLDEKQKEAIREIGSTLKKEIIRKRADIQVARIELKDILRQDNVNMSEAEAKLKQIASLRTDVGLLRIKAMEEIKSKLTPEQRTKLRENFESHRGWRHGDGGRKGFRDRGEETK